MYGKLDELKVRIENLLEREKELKSELAELSAKEEKELSKKEIQKINNITKYLNNISTSKSDIIKPKCDLLDMYVEAKELINKINSNNENKSVRTKYINKLADLLIKIQKIDSVLTYTDDDARKLQIERNNPEIFNEYFTMFDNIIDGSITILIDEINAELDKLEKANNSLDKTSIKKIGKIIGSVVLATGILIGVQSCSKNKDRNILTTKAYIDNYNNNDDDNLKVIGNDENINVVLTPSVTPKPAKIVNSEKEALEDKESDLIKRANDIAKTNFFEDAYASDIIDVLRAISDKQMWSTENAGYAQAFNTTFNQIVEKYLFDTITEEDINKVEALRELSKSNSDLDRFLEEYTTLLQNILRNPSDQKAKDQMMKYITIFATSLNGFTNEPEVLTNNDEFNEHAQVNDFFNWWFAYDSIIKPTYPLYYPKELENVDGMIIEDIMYASINMNDDEINAYIDNYGLSEYKDAILKQIKLYELQYLMESALVNHPQFCEIRNVNDAPTLTLGGEE